MTMTMTAAGHLPNSNTPTTTNSTTHTIKMPRVYGNTDTDQQHRYRRNRRHHLHRGNSNNHQQLRDGSIFSLPTPFQQQQRRQQQPQDDDDVSQSQYSSCRENSDDGTNDGDGDDNVLLLSSSSKNCMADDTIDIDANARAGDYSSSDIIGNGSSGNGVNDDNDQPHQQQYDASPYSCCSNDDNEHEQQAKANADDDGGNDSDATTLDGEESYAITAHDDKDDDGCNSSVDLLADDDNDANNNDNDNCQSSKQNGQCITLTSALSPISPATKTLNRLSQFSSSEGGAELCMHLLADAAAAVYASATSDIVASHHGNSEESLVRSDGSNNLQLPVSTTNSRLVDNGTTVEMSCGDGGGDNASPTIISTTATDVNCVDDDIVIKRRQQCLRNLKEYFMSTNNSSSNAKQQHHKQERNKMPASLTIPFCRRCNHPTAAATTTTTTASAAVTTSQALLPPHHGLCPQHSEFFDSGSYEILNLIVDGYLLVSCKACMYQFDNGGRMNKALCHADGCLRRKKSKKKKSSDSSSTNITSINNNDHELDVGGGDSRNESGDVQVTSLPVPTSTIDHSKMDNIDQVTDDVNQVPSPDHFDSSGHPLSDYERLRLRNMQRNNARLDQLGLLANTRPMNAIKNRKGGNKVSDKPGTSTLRCNPRRAATIPHEGVGKEHVANDQTTSTTVDAGGDHEKDEMSNQDLSDVVACNESIAQKRIGAKSSGSQFHDHSCQVRVGSSNAKEKKRLSDDCDDDEVDQRKLREHSRMSVKAGGNGDGTQRKHMFYPRGRSNNVAEPTDAVPKTPKLLPRRQSDTNKQLVSEESSESSIVASSILRGHAKPTNSNTHRPTPSPLHHQGTNPPQIPSLTPLPSWIKEFTSESLNETVPSPRGSKWLPCSNPWGKVGHEGNDFVILSPFQSETLHDVLPTNYHLKMPKRFVANPLELGSPYHATHCSPARGGYSVLRLRRDRASLRPWGFTVRLHEFGGACLVDTIEPLSPAEAAEDISGWVNENASSGLKHHDMVLCIDGKCIGNMTMAELQIELDVCGSELLLTVARFDIQEAATNQESATLQDLAIEWNNIGACASLKRKRVSFEDDGRSKTQHVLDFESYPAGSEGDDKQDNDSDNELHGVEVDDCRKNAHPHHMAIAEEVAEDNTRSREMCLCSESDIAKLGGTASLPMAAEFGCSKCKRELRTGIKTTKAHDSNCPRKGNPRNTKSTTTKQRKGESVEQKSTSQEKMSVYGTIDGESKFTSKRDANNRSSREHDVDDDSLSLGTKDDSDDEDDVDPPPETTKRGGKVVSLSMAAKLGCNKCKRELRTGIKTNKAHDQNCPRKFKPKTTTKRRKNGANAAHSTRSGKTSDNRSNLNTKESRLPKSTTQKHVSHIDEASGDDDEFTFRRAANHLSSGDQIDDGSVSCGTNEDSDGEDGSNSEGDGDENPWLGCVCGNTHPRPIKVFWIQCEGCEAWYNAAEECLGFDETAAKELSDWCCWACDPPVAGLGL